MYICNTLFIQENMKKIIKKFNFFLGKPDFVEKRATAASDL